MVGAEFSGRSIAVTWPSRILGTDGINSGWSCLYGGFEWVEP
jgi:hypothetical protein